MIKHWMMKGVSATVSSLITPTGGLLGFDDTPLSATYAANSPIIDGDQTTAILTCQNRGFGVDLGAAKQISKGILYLNAPATGRTGFYSDAYGTIDLYSSADNSTWILQKELVNPAWESPHTVGSTTCFTITITPDVPFTARYMVGWASQLADNVGSWVSMCETEAYS